LYRTNVQVSQEIYVFSNAQANANIYEKALFVKPTWRLLLGAECKASNALRAMLLSALSVSLPLGGSVHYGIRLDSGSTKVLRSS